MFDRSFVQSHSYIKLEDMVAPPREIRFFSIRGIRWNNRQINIPKRLRHKCPNLLISRDYKAQRGELAWA